MQNLINQIIEFMNTIIKNSFCILLILFTVSCVASKDNKDTHILIKTTAGDIKVRLYDETPLHRDNFIKLVNNHLYEGISFHRVIKDFMVQAGDPETKKGFVRELNDTICSYTIPAEFRPVFFHKKGALAAAREGNDVNPEMRSSGTQFYIVQGVRLSDEELDKVEQRINNDNKKLLFVKLMKEATDSNNVAVTKISEEEIKERAYLKMFKLLEERGDFRITQEQRNIYKSTGGTPWLDGTYTVFGEVVAGLDIIDKIAAVKTDENDKPLSDVRIIKMKVVRK